MGVLARGRVDLSRMTRSEDGVSWAEFEFLRLYFFEGGLYIQKALLGSLHPTRLLPKRPHYRMIRRKKRQVYLELFEVVYAMRAERLSEPCWVLTWQFIGGGSEYIHGAGFI